MKTILKNLSESEVEITCEIETVAFEKERPLALKKIGNEVTLPGFRKGHIPENMLAQRFGEGFILEEMANLAIDRAYPEILREHKVHAIAMPTVAIKKLTKGENFVFTLTFPVMPEIKLPDYKKIAKEIMVVEEVTTVTDDEVTKAQNELIKQFATKDADGKEILPEVTEELVQKFGPFANVAEFTAKIRESISHEKEQRARSKKRMMAMEKIADEMKVKLPQIIIDGELDRMMNQFNHDIGQMGMKLEDYLKTIKKTPEDMRKEWLPDADKRAKVQIALSHIAEAEKLEVLKEDLQKEVSFFLEHHKDADHGRATLHLEMVMMNEKVFQFLEVQK